MTKDKPASSARRRSFRARGARVLATLVLAGAAMCASIAPAFAGGAPAPGVASESTSHADPDGRSAEADMDVGALLMLVGLGLAIAAPVAGRARIARERSVRRFRAQLRHADLPGLCERPIATGHKFADVDDPPHAGDVAS